MTGRRFLSRACDFLGQIDWFEASGPEDTCIQDEDDGDDANDDDGDDTPDDNPDDEDDDDGGQESEFLIKESEEEEEEKKKSENLIATATANAICSGVNIYPTVSVDPSYLSMTYLPNRSRKCPSVLNHVLLAC